MSILVTGANGYIGRFVVRKLLEKGQDVLAADLNFSEVDDRATRIKADIFSGDSDIYEECGKPDVLIHMAWRNGFMHNHMSHITDLPKHYEFLKNMVDGGLKHLVVMGSMHEVGYFEGAITEDVPCNPSSLYGISKNALRQMVLLLSQNNDIIYQWIRGYYIFGDDARNQSIFSKIIQAAKDGKTEFPFTSGKNKYDFLNVEDLAEQICAVALQKEVTGIINCCSGVPISLGEKVESFIKDNGYSITLKYGAFPDRVYDSPAVWGDNTKIKAIMEHQS